MAVPKQKHTKSRRNKRRGNIFLEAAILTICQKCGKPVLTHRVCGHCGYYKNREVVDVLKKLDKKEQKKRSKEIAQKQTEEKTADEKAVSWEDLSKK